MTIKLTEETYRQFVDDNYGICINKECLTVQLGYIEPDAEKYECEECGRHSVYGTEQLLLIGIIEIADIDDSRLKY